MKSVLGLLPSSLIKRRDWSHERSKSRVRVFADRATYLILLVRRAITCLRGYREIHRVFGISHYQSHRLFYQTTADVYNGKGRVLFRCCQQWHQSQHQRSNLRPSMVRPASSPSTPKLTPNSSRVEKYRPVYLTDIVGNDETIERLKIIAKDGNMPHVIISGMPGIGKTTSILCLARQLLGPAYKEAVLELNASDERGIDVVRNRIKAFAQKKVTLPPGRQKLVILDEADSMTGGAQQALRRTMEIYSSTTRFAFACNQSNKIIEPLQSRCAILRYARLTDQQIVTRLLQVCEAEKVEYADDGIAALVFSAEGDMRQAINNLQSTSAGFGFVSGENVFKVVDSPHPIKVQAVIKACWEGKVDSAVEGVQELWGLGYSCHDIVSTMFRVTKTVPGLSEHARLEFIREIGFCHMRVLEGVQTLVQLLGCVAKLCKINMKPALFQA